METALEVAHDLVRAAIRLGLNRNHIQEILRENPDDAATPHEIRVAKEEWADGSNDELAVDDDALVSRGPDGTWVQAWVLISHQPKPA